LYWNIWWDADAIGVVGISDSIEKMHCSKVSRENPENERMNTFMEIYSWDE
jgi:hypothetical protein